MARFMFDIETNGLIPEMDRVHSICMMDLDTGEEFSYCDNPDYPGWDGAVGDALEILAVADEIVGHNIMKFDIPAIQMVYPFWYPQGTITDTLVISHLIWTNLRDLDFARIKRKGNTFPGFLIGRHSMQAWGLRLNQPKDEYASMMKAKGLDPWAEWNPTMQEYCEQDVRTNKALWDLIVSKDYSQESIRLEHEFQAIIMLQEEFGFDFNVQSAQRLYGVLTQRRIELENELREVFKPWYVSVKGATTQGRTVTYTKNRPFPETWVGGTEHCKVRQVEFNPGSRDHIADRLIKLRGWKPTAFGKDGKPTVDDTIVSSLPYPEAKLLAEYLMVQKRIGQLAEGKEACLKHVTAEGKIHGQVHTNGAVTGRCTHSKPNVAQTPAVGKPYGRDFRACYTPPPGWVLVGADASGLELRCLAHYMARWDEGAYADVILEGDIHTVNQKAAGLPTRDNAKTFIYAFLYGAGDEKIGSIVGKGKKAGKQLKTRFTDGLPALGKLVDAVSARAKTGWLRGLDGRMLSVRHQHAALNTLLQSAGALIMKKALILLYNDLTGKQGLEHGVDYAFVANVHDEFQIAVAPHLDPEVIGNAAVRAINDAGKHFKFRCPTDAEWKSGASWADTH